MTWTIINKELTNLRYWELMLLLSLPWCFWDYKTFLSILLLQIVCIISITIVSWSKWPELLLIKNWQILNVWSQSCCCRHCSPFVSVPKLSTPFASSVTCSVYVFCNLLYLNRPWFALSTSAVPVPCLRLLWIVYSICALFVSFVTHLVCLCLICLFLICVFCGSSTILVPHLRFYSLSAMPVSCLRLLWFVYYTYALFDYFLYNLVYLLLI